MLRVAHVIQAALDSGTEARLMQINLNAAFDRISHAAIIQWGETNVHTHEKVYLYQCKNNNEKLSVQIYVSRNMLMQNSNKPYQFLYWHEKIHFFNFHREKSIHTKLKICIVSI